MSRFNAKRLLVTGGTSGIGLATARRIAEEGGKVAVTGRNQTRLDAALATLPEGSLALQNDAADPAAAPPPEAPRCPSLDIAGPVAV